MPAIISALAELLSQSELTIQFSFGDGHTSQVDAQAGAFSQAETGSGSVEHLPENFGGLSLGAPGVVGMPVPYTASPVLYSAPAPSTPLALCWPTSTQYHANSLVPFNAPSYAFISDPPAPSPAPSNRALKRPLPPLPPVSNGPQCKALYDYNLNGQSEGDLTFRSGDVITIVREEDPDWWTGRLNGREGLIPSNYVERLSDQHSSSTSSIKWTLNGSIQFE